MTHFLFLSNLTTNIMDHIIDSIKSFIDMDKDTLDIFVGHLRPIRVPRKTILIKPLVKDNNVYMIERGIARSFNLINGREMTFWFS